jgi:hypothetical protein
MDTSNTAVQASCAHCERNLTGYTCLFDSLTGNRFCNEACAAVYRHNQAVEPRIHYLSESDSLKLKEYTVRLYEIFDRDFPPESKTRQSFQGLGEYLLRASIEALGLEGLFYEPDGMKQHDYGQR